MTAKFAPKLIAHFKSPHKVVVLGLATSSIGMVLASISVNLPAPGSLASGLVFVAGVSLAVPALIARTAAVTEPKIRGIAVSFYTFMLFVGASLAPFLIRSMAHYSLATVLLVLSMLLTVSILYNLLHRKGEKTV